MASLRLKAGENLRRGFVTHDLCPWRVAITFCFSMNPHLLSFFMKLPALSTVDARRRTRCKKLRTAIGSPLGQESLECAVGVMGESNAQTVRDNCPRLHASE